MSNGRQPSPRRAIFTSRVLPFTGMVAFALLWSALATALRSPFVPGPLAVARGIAELAVRGLLLKHVVASLFRVSWGYFIAVVLAVPMGFVLGWYRRADLALGPIIQLLRPISPIAWTPIAILWFGVGDLPAIFIIFMGAFFSITVATMQAVARVPDVYLRVGRNFGLSVPEIVRTVIVPACAPQLMVGLRLALGLAWVVVVAAEMLAVTSGLGYLIVDARNAGNRYDLIVGGMVLIGAIGVVLDAGMRLIESRFVRWKRLPARGEETALAPSSSPLTTPGASP